jgi:hypothetical protein
VSEVNLRAADIANMGFALRLDAMDATAAASTRGG